MSSTNHVGSFPPNRGFAINDGDVARALAAIETFQGVVPDDLLPHFQIAIDTNLVWRSELLTKVALRLIATGRCTRARRSYCPVPKPIRAKASRVRLFVFNRPL